MDGTDARRAPASPTVGLVWRDLPVRCRLGSLKEWDSPRSLDEAGAIEPETQPIGPSMIPDSEDLDLMSLPSAVCGRIQIHAWSRGQKLQEAVVELLALGLKVAHARDHYALMARRGAESG